MLSPPKTQQHQRGNDVAPGRAGAAPRLSGDCARVLSQPTARPGGST